MERKKRNYHWGKKKNVAWSGTCYLRVSNEKKNIYNNNKGQIWGV